MGRERLAEECLILVLEQVVAVEALEEVDRLLLEVNAVEVAREDRLGKPRNPRGASGERRSHQEPPIGHEWTSPAWIAFMSCGVGSSSRADGSLPPWTTMRGPMPLPSQG